MPPESQTPLPVQQNNRIEPYYHFHLYSWPGCAYRQHNTIDNIPTGGYIIYDNTVAVDNAS